MKGVPVNFHFLLATFYSNLYFTKCFRYHYTHKRGSIYSQYASKSKAREISSISRDYLSSQKRNNLKTVCRINILTMCTKKELEKLPLFNLKY